MIKSNENKVSWIKSNPLLLEMLELLSQKGVWCKDFIAKRSKSFPVGPYDTDARSFCIGGAFLRLSRGYSQNMIDDAYSRISIVLDGKDFKKYSFIPPSWVNFNDNKLTTLEDIITLLRKALNI